jgi:hypothetical protein
MVCIKFNSKSIPILDKKSWTPISVHRSIVLDIQGLAFIGVKSKLIIWKTKGHKTGVLVGQEN